MSSFFKQSFQSKQSKEFIELSIKAIPTIKPKAATIIYKSIKHGDNKQWSSPKTAMKCLEKKVILNMKITTYHTMVNDKNNSDRIIKSAKSHLTELLQSTDTKKLVRDIERGFKLHKGLLMKQITPQKPSTHSNRTTHTLTTPDTEIPNMKTKEYLQFLLKKALGNKVWNDNDADILCKCAISAKCKWITVHSMWVDTCYQLLLKYTLSKCKEQMKRHRQSRRRGSGNVHSMIQECMFEGNTIYDTKICVAIAHPLGQTSTASKVSETIQAINDGANKIRLMVSAGKIIMNDWEYIEQEVRSVVNAANGVKVDVVFPKHSRITEHMKKEFNQRILKQIASFMYQSTKRNVRKTAYSSATDDTMMEGVDGNMAHISTDKTDESTGNRKQSKSEESDDSESSASAATPKSQLNKQRKMNQKSKVCKNESESDSENVSHNQRKSRLQSHISIGMSVTDAIDAESEFNSCEHRSRSLRIKSRKKQKRKKREFHDDNINKNMYKKRRKKKKCRNENDTEKNNVQTRRQKENRRHEHRKRIKCNKSNKSKKSRSLSRKGKIKRKSGGHRRAMPIYC